MSRHKRAKPRIPDDVRFYPILGPPGSRVPPMTVEVLRRVGGQAAMLGLDYLMGRGMVTINEEGVLCMPRTEDLPPLIDDGETP